jgi:copper chaperone CopZ
MTCNHCTSSVRTALLACGGVNEVTIDLKAGRAHISGDDIQPDQLINAVEKAGYSASTDAPAS